MNPGIWGILIIAVAVVILFGRGKVAGMMGEFGAGIKAFQRGMKEEETAKLPEEEKDKSKDA